MLVASILTLALSTAPVRVVVVDISEPDAIYEDVSRGLADEVVAAFTTAGLDAVRITEDELPEAGCRGGPCLKEAARLKGAAVVVVVDAREDGNAVEVGVMAMSAVNGMPVAARRYRAGRRARKALATLVTQVKKALSPPDAGTR